MATSSSPSPTRAARPVFGLWTPTELKEAMDCGVVHVAPPSIDFAKATIVLLRVPLNGVFGGKNRSVKSYRVSVLGSTTMMLPIVCCRFPDPMMTWGGVQCTPPSVVFENSAGQV